MPTFHAEPPAPRQPHAIGAKSIRRRMWCTNCGADRRQRVDFHDMFDSTVTCCACGAMYESGKLDVPTDATVRYRRIDHAREIWTGSKKDQDV